MYSLVRNGMSFLRRAIFDPLHVFKNRSPKKSCWRELEKTQFLPERLLLETQWKRLSDIITFAYQNNRFYRERFDDAGVLPQNLKSPEDMQRIPILTKEEVQKNTSYMISQGYKIQNLLQCKTGGSTGKSLYLYITEECNEMRNACARRHDRWTGWEVGEPIGSVWGNPLLPTDLKSKLKNWLLFPFIYLDTMSITEASVHQFACEWERIRPTILFGHAHSLYILANYVKKLAIETIQPKSILSTSMMLMSRERAFLEDIFGVKVFNRYGCEEVGLIASECEHHQGMHLNVEHLFVEFIKEDGNQVAPGELGRIIITDLMNKAMPFIRYQVEDFGVPSDKRCLCGRGLPLMEKVIGRTADFLIKQDSTKVAGISLIENTLTKIPGIEQMQIIQEDLDFIRLKVVRGDLFTPWREDALKSYFQKLFGTTTRIQIEYVEKILPEKSGKYRFSICKVKEVITENTT